MAKSGTRSTFGPGGVEGSGDTRQALIEAAVETLKVDGFGRASARAIAGRAGCNQGLVFYHFGSVVNLLLAALDRVSAERLDHYGEAVGSVGSAARRLGRLVRGVDRCGRGHLPGGPGRRTRVRPGRDDRRRLLHSGPRPRGRPSDRAVDGLRRAGGGRFAGGLTGRLGDPVARHRLRHRGPLHRTGDAQPPRGGPAPALALFGHARQLAGLFDGVGMMPGPAPEGTPPRGSPPEGLPPEDSSSGSAGPVEVSR